MTVTKRKCSLVGAVTNRRWFSRLFSGGSLSMLYHRHLFWKEIGNFFVPIVWSGRANLCLERPAGSTLGLAKQDLWGLGAKWSPNAMGESFWQKESLLQRSYQRWLDKRIYETKMKFWAVWGSRGCREKKPSNCHKYATFWDGFFKFLWAIFF